VSVHDANYRKLKKELGIPEDEPIFILRAKDRLALPVITRYTNSARQIESAKVRPSDEWFEQMGEVERQFADFASAHPSQMKIPD
jgi:hypothetical protein